MISTGYRRRIHAEKRRWARLLATSVVILVVTGCNLNPNSIASEVHSAGAGESIAVMFTNVNNVPSGAPVTYNGTRVGRVESVRLDGDEVRVNAKVEPGLWFAVDVRAVVRQDTVLGDPYIALEGAPESQISRVNGGLVIPVSRSTAPPPLENTLSVVSTFVNGGSIQDMQSTIRSVNNTFPDLKQTVGVSRIVAIDTRNLARNIDRIDRMLGGMDGTAGAIIPNLDKLERMLSPDGRPEGVYYWRQLMDVMKEVGVLLPSVLGVPGWHVAVAATARRQRIDRHHHRRRRRVVPEQREAQQVPGRHAVSFHRTAERTHRVGDIARGQRASRRRAPPAADVGGNPMRMRNAVSVLGMLTIAVVSLAYMSSMGLSVTDNVGVRTASVHLPHSNNLVVGSRVLLRGEPIGKVTKVAAAADGVTVEWNYKDHHELPASLDLRVDNLSALGETYIAVTPRPGGGRLPEGQVLAGRSVVVPTTIDEFSARFTRLLEQVNAERVNTIIAATNQGLPADQKILDNFVRSGSLLQTTVLTTRSSFERLLRNMQPLLVQADDAAPDIAASGGPLADFGQAMGGFVNTGPWVTQAVNLPSGNDLLPYGLDIGVGPFLEDVLAFLTKASPDIKILADTAQPAVSSAARQLSSVDLSHLMKTALSAAGDGDGLVVRIGEK